jgi:nitrite reductase/ring-hydroxylating ferredoxin subunit
MERRIESPWSPERRRDGAGDRPASGGAGNRVGLLDLHGEARFGRPRSCARRRTAVAVAPTSPTARRRRGARQGARAARPHRDHGHRAGLDAFERFTDITIESWERVLAVNLTGTFHCLQAAVPDMLAARWGRMVTISSSSAQSGAPRMAHYARRRRRDRTDQGARAGARSPRDHGQPIPPGTIDTPMLRRAEAAGEIGKIDKFAPRMIPSVGRERPEESPRRADSSAPTKRLSSPPGDRRQRRHGPVSHTEGTNGMTQLAKPAKPPKQYPKPAEGTWTEHYPELGTAPVSYESSISPEFYQLEREAIFKRAWLNVGRVEQLRRKGCFFTKDLAVASTSLIIVAGMDDKIRAFHNVCRHRGNKLVWTDDPREETSGSCRQFACKYHGWRYELDGRCSFILQESEFFGSTRPTTASCRCTARCGRGSSS